MLYVSMTLFVQSALILTISMELYFSFKEFYPLLGTFLLFFIPAVFIIAMTKPDETYDLSELPLVGVDA